MSAKRARDNPSADHVITDNHPEGFDVLIGCGGHRRPSPEEADGTVAMRLNQNLDLKDQYLSAKVIVAAKRLLKASKADSPRRKSTRATPGARAGARVGAEA